MSIEDFENSASARLESLKNRLQGGSFKFSLVRPVQIPKRGKRGTRTIYVGTVEDRIVAKAILMTIVSKLAKKYSSVSSYCPVVRQKRSGLIGVPLAVYKTQEALKAGFIYVFETDIVSFFDNIDKEKILKLLKRDIKDRTIVDLLRQIVYFQVKGSEYSSGSENYDAMGIAQGSPLSPLLANLYLYPFDKILEKVESIRMIRYVDDLIILCRSKSKAEEIKKIVESEIKKLKLSIHSSSGKTRIVNVGGAQSPPLVFLGLQFTFSKVTLPLSKKREILDEIRDIMAERKIGLFEKTHSVRLKLEGCRVQYQQPHYSTEEDIKSLYSSSQKLLIKSLCDAYYQIFKYPLFPREAGSKAIDAFFRFLGLHF